MNKYEKDDTDEVLTHDYYGELPPYDALFYEKNISPIDIGFTDSPYQIFDETLKFNLTLVFSKNGNSEGSIDLTDVPIMKREIVENSNKLICHRRGE